MKNITPTKHYSSTFTPWSHVVSLLFAQLTHAIGLNDVCDTLRHHAAKLRAIRGAVAPSRNTLSHANRERDSDMMEALFWKVLGHLQELSPGFGPAGRYRGLPRRFKRAIHAIDSTTIALVANCMDWAKHRRRKAAAKMHLRLNLQSFLPGFAVIEEASHHDDTRTLVLCAGLQAGEIAVFDKAYVHFANLFHLSERGVFWVTRAKDNLRCHVCRKRLRKPQGPILRDDEVTLKVPPACRRQYPGRLRQIEVELEVSGEWVVMVFLTNNMDWAPSSVCDLYRCRWGIEVFFKRIKQTFKVCDFLGQFQAGHPLAAVGRPAAARSAPIHCLYQPVSAQLHPVVCARARRALGPLRAFRSGGLLWDSTNPISNVFPASTGLPARFLPLALWDSSRPYQPFPPCFAF